MQTSPGASEIIGPHGGYRRLISFQVAELVYDVTVRFCDKYVDRRSRTHDQMVQAARSGVQNAEIAANGTLALLAVACSLLDRQLASLAVAFQREGGFTERLCRARRKARGDG
jgi:four helix bundle suffix protein